MESSHNCEEAQKQISAMKFDKEYADHQLDIESQKGKDLMEVVNQLNFKVREEETRLTSNIE